MSLRQHAIQLIATYLGYFLTSTLCLHFFPGSAGLWAATILAITAALVAWHFNRQLVIPTAVEAPGVSPAQVQVGWGLGGIAIVLVAELIGTKLSSWLFLQPASRQPLAALMAAITTTPAYALAAVIALPVLEELVFRRVVFGNLAGVTGIFGAAVISGLLFGFATDPAHWLTATLVGIVYSYLYHATGSVNAPLIAHIGTIALTLGYAFTH
ncbi:CPBP family intramembrane glutamic endopeptidase [Lacticaseibacillus nasuensis]|uniref:CPBP family intramembrane glutamic endopeptidase n=1 Tax=Lacticaseibacillus nasuensis TaxID=944671 RepID=UPI002246B959|nr:CPBP family intramembrane glutamic endopeptidase [Lacticaseibacillus nasuensis]MCX2454451.1 CPBP family intramembrane metalloprotease [Lacticaseibacillus nasuensis]